ncbi:hypothetical protein [Candidatus Palauibacter sp.]|uniref:hypothetical protein n=1 Tax=Candidatus Palauibacter sp. TaxID=3101350 RepID=UPI003B01314E
MRKERQRSITPIRGSSLPALVLAAGLAAGGCAEGGGAADTTEWKNIAGNDMGQRYSSLDQIDAGTGEKIWESVEPETFRTTSEER